MESRQERPSDNDAPRDRPRSRDGKMKRILSELEGLLSDLRTWIDLRLDLAILKLEKRVSELQNNIALALTLAFFGFFAVLFTLTTVAVGVGWLLGHPFWGFLAVSVALLLTVVGLRSAKPELVPPPNLLESVRGKNEEDGTTGSREDGARVGSADASGEVSDTTV